MHRGTSEIIGCTRFANVEMTHRRLEIGWTWLAPAHQPTGANAEAKLLLLQYAFDVLHMNRVELKTDALNAPSRRAIARLGAVEEGVLRKHMVVSPTGRVRDTVYYSILDTEWAVVRERLRERVERNGGQSAHSTMTDETQKQWEVRGKRHEGSARGVVENP